MISHLYIEGGESKEQKIRCREGFRKLFEKAGFAGRLPRLTASGGRGGVFDDFKIAHLNKNGASYIAMLVDSEDTPADIEKTWSHLKVRDGWEAPQGAEDEQVLFMTNCMETWIVADRAVLREHYRQNLQENTLPPANNLESRHRHDIQERLFHATRNCANAYAKGKRSFDVLGMLEPANLNFLPSFARVIRILKKRL